MFRHLFFVHSVSLTFHQLFFSAVKQASVSLGQSAVHTFINLMVTHVVQTGKKPKVNRGYRRF
jgi:hypothetical protein